MSQPEDKEKIRNLHETIARYIDEDPTLKSSKNGSNSVHFPSKIRQQFCPLYGSKMSGTKRKKWRWCFTGEKTKDKPRKIISPQGANTNKINKQTTTPIDVRTPHQNFEATSAQQLLETSTKASRKVVLLPRGPSGGSTPSPT